MAFITILIETIILNETIFLKIADVIFHFDFVSAEYMNIPSSVNLSFYMTSGGLKAKRHLVLFSENPSASSKASAGCSGTDFISFTRNDTVHDYIKISS